MTSSTPYVATDHRPKWWQRLTRSDDDTRTAFPEISESAAIEDLFEVSRASLQRCGFGINEFELHLIRDRHSHHMPALLVELDDVDSLVWDFTNHLEIYLVDRLRRHGGFSVDRIVFTPKRRPGLDLPEARNGVRLVWSALQARRGRASGGASSGGPLASNPNLVSAAISAD